MLDFEKRKYTKFKFKQSISYQDINFSINFNMQISKDPMFIQKIL